MSERLAFHSYFLPTSLSTGSELTARVCRLSPSCRVTRYSRYAARFVVQCSAIERTTVSSEVDAVKRLQNGSDVRGVANELLGSEVTLSAERVRKILAAFTRDVSTTDGTPVRISIGRDSRVSGPALEEAAAAGVRDAGGEAILFGLATTPAMFMSTVLGENPYNAAVMLTASHLPCDRNGIKFFTPRGSASANDIRRILASAATGGTVSTAILTSNSPYENFMAVYAAHLVQLIRDGFSTDEPLSGLKFVVDAGNGAAGFFATDVLEPLGAEVYGQFLEPDGMFPNHIPNPEDKKAMAMTVESTVRENADLGIIFDTDGDRAGFVDERGTAINRNRLIAILARIVLRQAPGSTVVTDSVTSNGLKRFIEQNGGYHFRYRKVSHCYTC